MIDLNEFIEASKQDVIILIISNIIQLSLWVISTIIDFIKISNSFYFYRYYMITQRNKNSKQKTKKLLSKNKLMNFSYYYNKIGRLGIFIFQLFLSQIAMSTTLVMGFPCANGFSSQVLMDIGILIIFIIFRINIQKLNKKIYKKEKEIKSKYQKYFEHKGGQTKNEQKIIYFNVDYINFNYWVFINKRICKRI